MQGPDTVLASRLRNALVYSPDQQRIGDINDLIIKTDGTVEGVVVGVGGFLGIGEKNVALKMDRFKVATDPDGRARITLSATFDELKGAPDFKSKTQADFDRKADQWRQQQQPGRPEPKS